MIEVEIAFDKLDNIYGYKVSGHAGYKPHGEDIVCAGVSVLAQTAILGLEQYAPKQFTFSIEDGLLECALSQAIDEETFEKTQIILNTLLKGLLSLEHSYGKFIRIVKRRCL
jgi:uncharacterized protein YsxB (DUF464 family)